MDANQAVSRNLARFRKASGMTQEELGQRMGELTGEELSKASVSSMERSAEGGRYRVFDANDIRALTKILGVSFDQLFAGPDDSDAVPDPAPEITLARIRALVAPGVAPELRALIQRRLQELGTGERPLSFREAADRSRGLIAPGTIQRISAGSGADRLSDDAMRGLATALDLPLPELWAAAQGKVNS